MKKQLLTRLSIYGFGVLLLFLYYNFNVFNYNTVMSIVSLLLSSALFVEAKTSKTKKKFYIKSISAVIIVLCVIMIAIL